GAGAEEGTRPSRAEFGIGCNVLPEIRQPVTPRRVGTCTGIRLSGDDAAVAVEVGDRGEIIGCLDRLNRPAEQGGIRNAWSRGLRRNGILELARGGGVPGGG